MDIRLAEVTDPAEAANLAPHAHRILCELVESGAALGWALPPSLPEVRDLLTDLVSGPPEEAALFAAYATGDRGWLDPPPLLANGSALAGIGYWRRYARQTHRPHADLERVAVPAAYQGRGIGRA